MNQRELDLTIAAKLRALQGGFGPLTIVLEREAGDNRPPEVRSGICASVMNMITNPLADRMLANTVYSRIQIGFGALGLDPAYPLNDHDEWHTLLHNDLLWEGTQGRLRRYFCGTLADWLEKQHER